jgi:Carboxypeptidase regulatory-like domain/TonB dependent receptor
MNIGRTEPKSSGFPRPAISVDEAAKKFPGLATLAMLLLLLAKDASGQSAAFATIAGRVLDAKGASVSRASVTATNVETAMVRKTDTTEDGLYQFDHLTPGLYDISVEAGSFAQAEAKNLKLQVGERRDVNFNLVPAGRTENVLVVAETPLIETAKTDVSTVINDRDVANLPTTTSYQDFGGVANDYLGLVAFAPGLKYDYSGSSFDIVGPGNVNDHGVNINVDGGNISDQVISARDALGASVEEVEEVQVLTNNYNAEYGQAGNTIVNVVTKSGTNAFHGDAHAYFRGRNLGASSYFYNLTNPTDRAPFFKHEYGFTAGGPLVKNRFFWFASLEDVHQGSPATLLPFGSPITVNQPVDELLWSGRVDVKLTDKQMLTARYNLQRDFSTNALFQTGSNTDPSGLVEAVAHDNGLNIGLVSTLTPHILNEARFYWHRFLATMPTNSTEPGQALPNAYVGANFCCPMGTYQNRFQYIDNFSWMHGHHSLKFGFNISHFPYDYLYQQFHYGRYESFTAQASCAPYGLCPTQFTIGAGPGETRSSDNIFGFYAQDSWQVSRGLTINYGLRYDIEDGAFNGGTIPAPNVPGGCLQSNGLLPACGSDKNNWQPRLGIAWSPNFDSGLLHRAFGSPGKSVIRAAGGVITEMAFLNIVVDSRIFDGVNLETASISATDCFTRAGTINPHPSDPAACAVLAAYPNTPSAASLEPFTSAKITNFGTVRPLSPTIKNPQFYMASLVVERQIGSSLTFGIGYQGVFGHRLFGEKDTNFPTPIADPAHPGYLYMPDRPDPSFDAIRTIFSDRSSGYNSLVVTGQKRLAHHFQFSGSYIYSKMIDNSEDFYGVSEPANPLAPLSEENALSQIDMRHQGSFSLVADTNNLVKTRFFGTVLNNWTFGALGSLQSGRPFPISTGDGAFSGSNFPAIGAETNQRPSICTPGSQLAGCAGAPTGALVATNIASISGTNLEVSQAGVAACQAAGLANCAALLTTYEAPAGASKSGPVDSFTGTPVDFRYISGNLVRNAGQTLPLYRFDISLLRTIKIPKWEAASLQLKMDVFNVFNHPLFILNNANDVLNFLSLPKLEVNGLPNPNFNCLASCINPFSGLYLGADGRVLTWENFQRASYVAAQNFKGLGGPSAEVTPRIIQLAVRFSW